MANHVSTWIEVQSEKKEVYQRMMEMFDGSTYEDWGDTMWWYRKLYNLDDDVEYHRDEYTNSMGTKWCHFEDVMVEEDMCDLTTVSAWDFPFEAIEQLLNILSEIDEDVSIVFNYEDESLNPVGGGIAYHGNVLHYNEDVSHLWEKYDSEDAPDDDMWDVVYETKDACMQTAIAETILQKVYDDLDTTDDDDIGEDWDELPWKEEE